MKTFLFVTFALMTQVASGSLLWNSTFLFHATHATEIEDIQPSDFNLSYTFPGANSPFTVNVEGLTGPTVIAFDEDEADEYGVDWTSLEGDVTNHWGLFEDPFAISATLVTEFTTYNSICCQSSWLNRTNRNLEQIVISVERFGFMSPYDPDYYALIHVMLLDSPLVTGGGGDPGEPSMPEPSTLVLLVGSLVLFFLCSRRSG